MKTWPANPMWTKCGHMQGATKKVQSATGMPRSGRLETDTSNGDGANPGHPAQSESHAQGKQGPGSICPGTSQLRQSIGDDLTQRSLRQSNNRSPLGKRADTKLTSSSGTVAANTSAAGGAITAMRTTGTHERVPAERKSIVGQTTAPRRTDGCKAGLLLEEAARTTAGQRSNYLDWQGRRCQLQNKERGPIVHASSALYRASAMVKTRMSRGLKLLETAAYGETK